MTLNQYQDNGGRCMFTVHPYADAWWCVRDQDEVQQLKVCVQCVNGKKLFITMEAPRVEQVVPGWSGQDLLDAIHTCEGIPFNKMRLIRDGNTVFADTQLLPGPLSSPPFHLHIASRRFSEEAAARASAAALTPATAALPSSPASPTAIAFNAGANKVFTIPSRDDPCPGPVSPPSAAETAAAAAAAAVAATATATSSEPAATHTKTKSKPKRKILDTCIPRVPSPNKTKKAKLTGKINKGKHARDAKPPQPTCAKHHGDLQKGTRVSVKWVMSKSASGFKWYSGVVQYVLQRGAECVVGVKYRDSRKVHELARAAFANPDCVRIIE